MRQHRMIVGVAALLALSACAGDGMRTDATPPTVSYTYDDDEDFDRIVAQAEDYCDDRYDQDAVLVDQDDEGSTYEATFACE